MFEFVNHTRPCCTSDHTYLDRTTDRSAFVGHGVGKQRQVVAATLQAVLSYSSDYLAK